MKLVEEKPVNISCGMRKKNNMKTSHRKPVGLEGSLRYGEYVKNGIYSLQFSELQPPVLLLQAFSSESNSGELSPELMGILPESMGISTL